MPDVDVSLRGAASIARRLQDPLAELVKIDPKSIGVGQYQHDVNQSELARTLEAVVEDCVNSVGVDLNTASVPLLTRVSGLSASVAKAVVRWRESNGAFRSRQQLMDVSGLGAKTFEQSAGFLRIRGGDNPLDMTGVHPETYPVVEKMMATTGKPVTELMGRAEMLKTLKPELFAEREVRRHHRAGTSWASWKSPAATRVPTSRWRASTMAWKTSTTCAKAWCWKAPSATWPPFGAFVDLGVHQDGLVHVSQLAHKFVNDAREIVKTGDIVKVKVVEVDVARKRIALSMKLGDAPARRDGPRDNRFEGAGRGQRAPQNQPANTTAMAGAFAKLQGLKK